jgi:AraC-like DNA-binding protein/mannose-6-phosphate isomerase-like protein (cupin superfamily)
VSSIFEKIDHKRSYSAKIFVTRLDSSKLHWHYDYELLVILSGSLQVFSGPAPFLMNTGDIVLLNSKVIHGFKSTGNENLCLFIQFPPSLFERVLGTRQLYHFYLNSTNNILAPKIPFRYFVGLASRIGISSRQCGAAAELRTYALLQTLIADLVEYVEYDIRSGNIGGGLDSVGEYISEISIFIDTHLQDESLSADISKNFGITGKTLYRYLKNITGQTLKSLINTARVEKSKQLLRETEKNAMVIADECGFFNEATFYRVFKKETGRTPKEYRQGGNSPASSSSPLINAEIQGYLKYDDKTADLLLSNYAGRIE